MEGKIEKLSLQLKEIKQNISWRFLICSYRLPGDTNVTTGWKLKECLVLNVGWKKRTNIKEVPQHLQPKVSNQISVTSCLSGYFHAAVRHFS